MVELDDVRQGWNFMAEVIGADQAAAGIKTLMQEQRNVEFFNTNANLENINIDNVNAHINEINSAIDRLADKINNHPHVGNTLETFKGYAAEEWHAETFNIDAIRDGSKSRAWSLQSNADASVDIATNINKNYSLKYYNDVGKAENAQAILSKNSSIPKYEGQERLIAYEQVDKAKEIAHERMNKNAISRPHAAYAHYDTENHLVGRIEDNYGHHSKELSIKESREIAQEAKEGKFNPENHGIKKEALKEYVALKDEIQINYVDQALKAGLTAAAITAITQIVPELYKSVDYLIKNGEIDLKQVAKSSAKVVSASGEAFLRGSIAYGLEVAIEHGIFGESIKTVSPTVVGAMVTIVLGTIKSSILVAAGKITKAEMGMKFVDTVIMSSGYLVGMKIGGVICQAIAPQLPGLAYAIGSLIGCSVAVVYNIGKKKLISFCIDTGFTCFGLVEQNYELPESVLHQLGIDTINIGRTDVQQIQIDRTNVFDDTDEYQYETIDITMLKRGVIGVNKIGYII